MESDEGNLSACVRERRGLLTPDTYLAEERKQAGLAISILRGGHHVGAPLFRLCFHRVRIHSDRRVEMFSCMQMADIDWWSIAKSPDEAVELRSGGIAEEQARALIDIAELVLSDFAMTIPLSKAEEQAAYALVLNHADGRLLRLGGGPILSDVGPPFARSTVEGAHPSWPSLDAALRVAYATLPAASEAKDAAMGGIGR